jgi:nuclear pore complex protein Nup155
MIFKAQEQLKRASESGSNTDLARNMLNESLRLLEQVAGSLSLENLHSIIEQFMALQFYAGSIQLCLKVATEVDRGNRALAWFNDGKPADDPRKAFFEKRKECYNLVHQILQTVDQVSSREPEMIDGRYTITARKRNEAYAIINESEDETFHYDLYDWYLEQGWTDRLLAVQSPYVTTYLQRKATKELSASDLLWRFYANNERFYEAATVQLELSKGAFDLSLESRIEYLSRAKANASTHTAGVSRQARQVLLHEVSELLEVANIQDEILQRLKGDDRIDADRKPEVLKELNSEIIDLSTVSFPKNQVTQLTCDSSIINTQTKQDFSISVFSSIKLQIIETQQTSAPPGRIF